MFIIRFVNIIVGAMVLLLSLLLNNMLMTCYSLLPLIINKIEDRTFHLITYFTLSNFGRRSEYPPPPPFFFVLPPPPPPPPIKHLPAPMLASQFVRNDFVYACICHVGAIL